MKITTTPLIRQYVVIIAVNLMNLCVGLDLGWPSPVLVKLRDPKQSPLSRSVTDDECGWIVSIGFILSLFVLPFIGILLDYIGRRYSILMICLPKIFANIATIFASELWILLVARVINGLTTLATYIVTMVYTTEICSKEIRGSLGSFIPIFTNVGMLLIFGIGPFVSYLNLNIMISVLTVLSSIPQLLIPDTPYSLYKKGKIEEAKKVLIFLRGSKLLAEEELTELSQDKSGQKLNKRKDIFKNKVYLKTFTIATILGFGIQITGFNCIAFYLQTILELSNTSVSPAIGSIVIGFISLISCVIAGIFIDRYGRRPILISTFLTLALGMFGLSVFFLVQQHGAITGFLNYLPLISVALVTCSFNGGIGCLYFVIVTELLDGPIRAIATTASSIASTVTISLLSRFTINLLSSIGPDATFFTFGLTNIMMSLFIFFFVPETKQKTLAEIQMALGQKKKKEYVTKF